jgi:hypothetical protein
MFNWHKSRTLPKITVFLQDFQRLTEKYRLTQEHILVKISACVISIAGDFEDVGLDGKIQELRLSDGIATFKNLKFRETWVEISDFNIFFIKKRAF